MARSKCKIFRTENVNDTVGAVWGDVDCVARSFDEIITDLQVIPEIGESIDGDFDVVGFRFC